MATAGAVPAGTRLSDRDAWFISIRYTLGPRSFVAHYSKARDDRAAAAQNRANMVAPMYA